MANRDIPAGFASWSKRKLKIWELTQCLGQEMEEKWKFQQEVHYIFFLVAFSLVNGVSKCSSVPFRCPTASESPRYFCQDADTGFSVGYSGKRENDFP